MKFSAVLVLFLIGLCKSNDLKCGHSLDELDSVEFYCENFKEPLPANCSSTFLERLNEENKLKVIRLKVGACDHGKLKELVNTFPNLHTLDISQSGIESLDSFDLQHKQVKFNVSHNEINEIPKDFFSKMPNVVDVDFSYNPITKMEWILPLLQRGILMDISWKNVKEFDSREHMGDKIHVIVDNEREGIFHSPSNGKNELYCSEMSFEKIV